MRCVKHKLRADTIRNSAHLCDRMFKEVEAAADGDQFGAVLFRQFGEFFQIHGVAIRRDPGFDDIQSIKTCTSSQVMRHMPADAGRWHNNRIAGPAGRHEPEKVGDGARGHPDLRKSSIEHFRTKRCADHFNFLYGFQPHFVFVTGIPQRRSRSDARSQKRLCPRVHDIGRGVEVETLLFVDPPVIGSQRVDTVEKYLGALCRAVRRNALHEGFAV